MDTAIPVETDTYLHHIPGRLRIRSALVKRNEARAAAATAWLRSLPGVRSARANVLTGSLTVEYDPSQTQVEAILSSLRQAGWISTHHYAPTPGRRPTSVSGSDLAFEIAGRVALFTLEKAAEHSLIALVSAIL